jgi:GTP-binding protein
VKPTRVANATVKPDDWRVTEARFEISAPALAGAPAPDRPEFAVAGRSNAGKSSLLNALTGRTGLARTSAAPGRTQLLNFFAMTLHGKGAKLEVRCADLPGYGYAAVPSKVRNGFAPMVEPYLLTREPLRTLLVLLDTRRGVDERDIAMIEFVAGSSAPRAVDVLVVGTKADKLGATDRGLWTRSRADELGLDRRNVFITSARTKDGLFGKGGLLSALAQRLSAVRP